MNSISDNEEEDDQEFSDSEDIVENGSTEIKEPKEPKRSQRSSSKNRKLLGSLISVKKCLFFLAPYFPYFTIKRSQHRNTMFNLI